MLWIASMFMVCASFEWFIVAAAGCPGLEAALAAAAAVVAADAASAALVAFDLSPPTVGTFDWGVGAAAGCPGPNAPKFNFGMYVEPMSTNDDVVDEATFAADRASNAA